MKTKKNNRIPRKKKKEYKNLWQKRLRHPVQIIKASIEKKKWGDSLNNVWGCEINVLHHKNRSRKAI